MNIIKSEIYTYMTILAFNDRNFDAVFAEISQIQNELQRNYLFVGMHMLQAMAFLDYENDEINKKLTNDENNQFLLQRKSEVSEILKKQMEIFQKYIE